METFQVVLITGILLVWFMISISIFTTSIQTIIDNHKDEIRKREAAARDEEYHKKRMESLQ